jgi:SAM-dependent methyltransferase
MHPAGMDFDAADEESVRSYYDVDPEREWRRTRSNFYHRIEPEILRTMFLRPLLQSSARVLDVGCGPGTYALELAAQGHQVMLADLSGACLDQAVMRLEAAGLGGQILGVQHAAADRLAVAGETFDVVLMLGPLYHYADDGKAREALRRARAALRPGGQLVATFVTRNSVLKDLIKRGRFAEVRALAEQGYLETGIYRPLSVASGGDYMPTTRTHTLTEACALLAEAGLVIADAASLEGLAAFMAPYVNGVVDSDESLAELAQTLTRTARQPDVIAAGDHFAVRAVRSD